MKISVRFTAAVHTLLCIRHFQKDMRVTSDFIAASTGVNAVIIRKILLQLQKAGLVQTTAGAGGSRLAQHPDKITLLDVYNAINEGDEERNIFNFHPNPNPKCPVGSKIHLVLDVKLDDAQKAMKDSLNKTTIADLSKDI
ncbi:Rrf2 family transcriptional regulator [Treponema putidum]|uniref:Rrf2 family transcriptional regulator n=1 Tax=Treponema putidum TaxID=221027 RepID=UPI00210417DA|nr:Rrf2 family transcriptional regulator [Treponema putidum]UTY32369.1 Rrf2 family transcriptional regulator [Treponema putidum]